MTVKPYLRGGGSDEARVDETREADAGDVARGAPDAVELPDGLRRRREVLRQEAAAYTRGIKA